MSGENKAKPSLSRRGFLKATGVAVGAAAATTATGSLTALADSGAPSADSEEKVITNWCRGNCGGPCQLDVKVREGHVVQVRPHDVPLERIGSRQGCVRGQTSPQRLYNTRRVYYPMRRVGARGAGEWERISWDEAMKEIGEKFNAAIEEYGPSALALYHSYGSSTWLNGCFSTTTYHPRTGRGIGFERFIRKTGCTLFAPSADMCQMYMASSEMLGTTFAPANDILNSDLVILWASNPTDACRAYWPFVCDAHDKGTKIYCIDPQFTMAATKADVYLPIRPGTDSFLMLAMANYAYENDLYDHDYFANKSVAPLLIKEDGTYLKMSDLGVAPTVTTTATGATKTVDHEVVWDPATGQAGSSFGVKDPAITGSYEVAGFQVRTVFDYVYEQVKDCTLEKAAEVCDLPLDKLTELANDYAMADAATIMTFQGLGHHYNSRHCYKNMAYLASMTGNINKKGASVQQNMMGEMLVGGKSIVFNRSVLEVPDTKPNEVIGGLHLPEIVETGKWGGKDWPIKALYVFCGNPIASDTGRKDMIEAFDKIGFVVTSDSFMSDTALYSDIVLPVAMSYECVDMIGMAGNSAFLMQKAVEPLGEARPDMDIWRGFADQLGFPELYDKSDEDYLRASLDNEENRKNDLTYDEFNEIGGLPGGTTVFEYVGKESNATGRTQFYLPVVVPRSNHGRELAYTENIPWWEPPIEASVDNPLYERYPLFGLSDHNNYHAHSMYTGIPWLDDLREPYCRINEETAAARGIEQGDLVRVYNDRGECVLKAVLTKGIRPDTVLMPHGWQAGDYVKGHHQELTRIDPDPVCSNSAYYDYLCEVEKYEEGDK